MMENKTYDQRVKDIAAEMAEIAYVSDEGVFDPEKIHWHEYSENWIKAFMPIAQIALKHMAESAERAALDWLATNGEGMPGGINKYLQSLGLVPENNDNE